MAVVGPARSGKSALVAAISGHLHRPAKAYGEVLINGLPPNKSGIRPTYFSAWDEPMLSLTIEQVLIYTGTSPKAFSPRSSKVQMSLTWAAWRLMDLPARCHVQEGVCWNRFGHAILEKKIVNQMHHWQSITASLDEQSCLGKLQEHNDGTARQACGSLRQDELGYCMQNSACTLCLQKGTT